MQKFIISTDSCSDLAKSRLEKNQIRYIVLKRITEGVITEEIYDKEEEFVDFYDSIKRGALPTTSLINEYEMREYFQRVLDSSEGDIIHVALSSGLSTTCENAIAAAAYLNNSLLGRKIYVVDSLSASLGMGMLVERLMEMRDNGMSAIDAVQLIQRIRDNQQVWAIIGDLRHLKRSGRISGFKAAVGTFLGVKPILVINSSGKLVIEKTIKGERRAVEYVVDRIREHQSKDFGFAHHKMYLIHSCELRLAKLLEDGIREKIGDIKLEVGYIGPIIGTHVGDGTVGIVFEGTKRLDIN